MGRFGMRAGRRGERHPLAKLTADDVRAIRAAYAARVPHKVTARMFGIHPSNAAKIARRETWRDVA